VSAEVTVVAETVLLSWCCKHCGHSWPITNAEQRLAERRGATPDRRRIVRKDRRRGQ
jgi:hypothetical protein